MPYEWLTIAAQKVWEGFFWTIGVGIAAAIAVSIAVGTSKKILRAIFSTPPGKHIEKIVVGLHGNNSRERITSGKKKTVQ